MTAAFIHVIGDFLQSLGVFIAAIVIYFKPEWNIIDPICTFVFSLLVLATTISRGGYRFAKLIETNILEQISMLEHILRLFSIESKWFPSNLAFIPDI